MQGVLTLDESEGKARQEGAVAESPVPAGGDNGGSQIAGDSPQCDSVQAPRAEPSGSPGVSIGNFDVLASLNEAEQFAWELKKYADAIPDPRWQAIAKAMDIVIKQHENINAPTPRG